MKRRSCGRDSRREERIGKLREQVEAMGGMVGVGPGCPPEIEERFLQHVLACELQEEGPSLREHLRRAGVQVPRPDELDDATLPLELRQLIDGLAGLRVYLHSTDHLNDRELYRYLCEEMLEDPVSIDSDPHSAWHIDLVGSGSEGDIALYLRYYAEPEERALWAVDFPDLKMPPREKRPFDRDRHLPRPPWR